MTNSQELMASREAQGSEQSEPPREVNVRGRGWCYSNFNGFELGFLGLMCSDKYAEDELQRSHFDQWFDFAIDEGSKNDELGIRIKRTSDDIPNTKVSIKFEGGLSVDSEGNEILDGGVLAQGEGGDGVGRFKISFMVSHEDGRSGDGKRGEGWFFDDFPGYSLYFQGLTNGFVSLKADQWFDLHLDERSPYMVLRFLRKEDVQPARTKVSVKLEGGLSEHPDDGERVVFDGGFRDQQGRGDGVARFGLSFQVAHVEPPPARRYLSSSDYIEAQKTLAMNAYYLNHLKF